MGMGFGGLWMLVFLLLPLVGLYLVLADRPKARHRSAPRSAVEAARERYARGEIDRETYLGMIRDLEG